MEIKEMIELIKAVSDYGLTEFEVEQNDVKMKMKKEIVYNSERVVYTLNPTEGVTKSPENSAEVDHECGNVVSCPLVGTFYSAPSPEAEDFVKVGDQIKKGQVLGIVEAMKLMNEIESEYDGVLEKILVNNEDTVEYGQPLFVIR